MKNNEKHKYIVVIQKISLADITVEASSIEEAREKVSRRLENVGIESLVYKGQSEKVKRVYKQ